VQRYQGNYHDPLARPTASVHLRAGLTPRWALGGTASAGELAADRAFAGAYLAADLHAIYYLLPESRLTPFVQAGGGVLVREAVERQRTDDQVFPYLAGAVGLELMATPRLGLSVSVGNDYALIDGLDGVTGGTGHDSVWSLRTGLTWYPFD
jgi:curli production assembly/transport component CsgG